MKYNSPEDISDEVIREAFKKANSVKFSARRFNHLPYRSITFGDLGWWLPLTRVLPLIGITPQMLRPVFNRQEVVAPAKIRMKRSFFPGLLEILGSLSKKYREEELHNVTEVELPEKIESYEQLGFFPLDCVPFRELARILGKSVEVLREDGATGWHYHLFTVSPSGEITES